MVQFYQVGDSLYQHDVIIHSENSLTPNNPEIHLLMQIIQNVDESQGQVKTPIWNFMNLFGNHYINITTSQNFSWFVNSTKFKDC